jgi:chemotaxis protein CheD
VRERVIAVADWAVDRADAVLVTLGLGSCVAVVLYDPEATVGGLAHLLLPSPSLSQERGNPAKFPETAVPFLLDRMREAGAVPRRVRARLAGGASMFASLSSPAVAAVGERNLVATREALERAGIPLVGEDTGKDYGRSVYAYLDSGRMEVRSYAHGVRIL